ncbi:MAG: AraC family transcriptional regulator [Clostridia bacterium]|nr:AraC family transcriptional regulator [Clostridia bacterium]
MADQIINPVKTSAIDSIKPHDLLLYNGEHNYTFAKDEIVGPLIRTYYVFRHCLKGRGKLVTDLGTMDIKAGQSYIIFPGMVVSEISDNDDPLHLSYVTFIGIRAGILFKNIGLSAKEPFLPWEDGRDFLPYLNITIDACSMPGEETELFRIGNAYIFFDNLIKFLRANYPRFLPDLCSDDYIEKALQYMDLNYTKSIKVSDVAAHVGLNRSYFFTIFKSQLNLSPQEYLTRLRMQKACELFAYPEATVASVANSLNYEPSVFFRHFKRIMGVSPSEYKKMLSSDTGVISRD